MHTQICETATGKKEGCILSSDLLFHPVLCYNSDDKTSSSHAVIRKEKTSSSSLAKKHLQFHRTVEDETVPSKDGNAVHNTDPDIMPISGLAKKVISMMTIYWNTGLI